MRHIAIIGNGIAGITAARHIRKNSDFRITVISAESKYFWSRTALMYIYMGHMKYEHTKPYEDWFWKKNRIDLIHDFVQSIDTEKKQLILKNEAPLDYDALIIATGSRYSTFDWPGQDLAGVTGMVSLQDLEKIEQYTQGITRGVVVGGGLLGIELSEMLHSRKIPVTFLVREDHFWNNILPDQGAAMIDRHLIAHGIDLRLQTELSAILPDENGRVRAVVTSKGEEIPCQFVGLTAGVYPNIALTQSAGIDTGRGVLVNEFLETNIQDIYAIGDCAELKSPPEGRAAVEQVWYTGRMMGETVAETICGKKTAYNPGPWFNSAKFFDIEFQTYGQVRTQLGEHESDFYWEHESGKRAMHFVYNTTDRTLVGVNTFGIRLRHECFDQWLRNRMSINYVMEHLCESNFDPEFYQRYENEIIRSYNAQNEGHEIVIKKRKKLMGLF